MTSTSRRHGRRPPPSRRLVLSRTVPRIFQQCGRDHNLSQRSNGGRLALLSLAPACDTAPSAGLRGQGWHNVNPWSGSRRVVTRCVCVAADALRKLRFSANFSDHKRASGSRLRARPLRARGFGQLRSSASGSHVLVTRCVWCLPDHECVCHRDLANSEHALDQLLSTTRRSRYTILL